MATLRMVDVLVTQHSKWTARRIRRALFGQSLVDFNSDPWVVVNSQEEKAGSKGIVQKRSQKKQSRLEIAFSQEESNSSQETVVQCNSSQETEGAAYQPAG